MEENKVHAVCDECHNEFDYVLKPGYPRKYCPVCSAKKKQAYEDRQPVEVVKPGQPIENQAFQKAPTPPENKHLTMYVSYAKDIFCALRAAKDLETAQSQALMKVSTDLVKQAMKELN